MNTREIEEFIKRVLEEGEVDERTFSEIQSALVRNIGFYSKSQPDENLIKSILNDDELYTVLEGMQDSYNIQLFTPALQRRLKLHPMRKRASEILGHGLVQLKSFYEKTVSEPAEAELVGPVERGFIYTVRIGKNLYMVKPLQGEKEHIVAPIAAEARIGPVIEEISEDWMAEEYIEGPELQNIKSKPEEVAQILAYVYGSLHKRHIVYNDRFHDHLLFPNRKRGPVLIDYGASFIADTFSEDIDRVEKYLDDAEAFRQFTKAYSLIESGRSASL